MKVSKKSKLIKSIASVRDIESLMTYKGIVEAHRHGQVKLRIPGLGEREANSFETTLNKHLSECGCLMGKIFLLGALALAVIYQLFRGNTSVRGIITGAVTLILAAVAGGAIGKMIGLAIANVKFRKTCTALKTRLAGMG